MHFKSTKISLYTYMIVITLLFVVTFSTDQFITVMSQNTTIAGRKSVIVDAGHGGVDGGATSCTGALESNINLEIALRLEDLMHLLGIQTKMIRTTDCSVYTEGETIAAKKISDLKERVRIVNNTENAVLISIHQNYFSQSQYSGAQVFYSANDQSRRLGELMQMAFVSTLNINSNRKSKKASGIYLMEHIECPGILIECGFLSNEREEKELRSKEYQQRICCVIASVCSMYLNAEQGLA